MSDRPILILGGGNTAFSVAAKLALEGREIVLYEVPEFAASLAPLESDPTIQLLGAGGEGRAQLGAVTTDVSEALADAELLLLIVPSYAHGPFARACIPHLRRGQTLVLMPGNLGTLEWAKMLREAGKDGWVTLAEVDTAPYVCRKTAPDTATIWGIVSGLGVGVLPSTRSDNVRAQLDELFPGTQAYPDVLACGLSAMNPVIHPAGVLMNAGRVEYSRGEFYFYEEGVMPSVVRVIEALDGERLAIGKALGHDLLPVHEAFHAAGFGPRGDLWSTINGSWMLTRLKAPGSLESRWLTEDIPFGLVPWCSLAEQLGVDTPVMRSLINLGIPVMGFDAWKKGRTAVDLGIDGLSTSKIAEYLTTAEYP